MSNDGLQFFHTLISRGSTFNLMLGHSAFMPTLFKLLLPKPRYMGDEECKIQPDVMKEIYMMAVLNLKTARDKISSSNLRSKQG